MKARSKGSNISLVPTVPFKSRFQGPPAEPVYWAVAVTGRKGPNHPLLTHSAKDPGAYLLDRFVFTAQQDRSAHDQRQVERIGERGFELKGPDVAMGTLRAGHAALVGRLARSVIPGVERW